jgi:ethanolamine transporter EutH
MFKRPRSLIFLIYVIIGLVVAWDRGYITVGLLKGVLSALLAIFLWFLVLLGISMHLH